MYHYWSISLIWHFIQDFQQVHWVSQTKRYIKQPLLLRVEWMVKPEWMVCLPPLSEGPRLEACWNTISGMFLCLHLTHTQQLQNTLDKATRKHANIHSVEIDRALLVSSGSWGEHGLAWDMQNNMPSRHFLHLTDYLLYVTPPRSGKDEKHHRSCTLETTTTTTTVKLIPQLPHLQNVHKGRCLQYVSSKSCCVICKAHSFLLNRSILKFD